MTYRSGKPGARESGPASEAPARGFPIHAPQNVRHRRSAAGPFAARAEIPASGGTPRKLAHLVNPALEDEYWMHHYHTSAYVAPGAAYEAWRPAYRYGWESRVRYPGRTWSEVEEQLGRDWDRVRGESPLGWHRARHAARDAWERITRTVESAEALGPKGQQRP